MASSIYLEVISRRLHMARTCAMSVYKSFALGGVSVFKRASTCSLSACRDWILLVSRTILTGSGWISKALSSTFWKRSSSLKPDNLAETLCCLRRMFSVYFVTLSRNISRRSLVLYRFAIPRLITLLHPEGTIAEEKVYLVCA